MLYVCGPAVSVCAAGAAARHQEFLLANLQSDARQELHAPGMQSVFQLLHNGLHLGKNSRVVGVHPQSVKACGGRLDGPSIQLEGEYWERCLGEKLCSSAG